MSNTTTTITINDVTIIVDREKDFISLRTEKTYEIATEPGETFNRILRALRGLQTDDDRERDGEGRPEPCLSRQALSGRHAWIDSEDDGHGECYYCGQPTTSFRQ